MFDVEKLDGDIKIIAKKVHDICVAKNSKEDDSFKIATAESCTGGLIGAYITALSGSSAYYEGGCISYSNEIKHNILNVTRPKEEELEAVCEQTACEMAQGARVVFGADIAVSVTGIAGPTGGSDAKPAGTVWIGLSYGDKNIAYHNLFKGDRQQVRMQTVKRALELVYDVIK